MPSPVPDSVTDSAPSHSRQISVPTPTRRTFALFSTRRGGPSSTPQRFLGGLQDPHISLIYYFQAWFIILSLSLSLSSVTLPCNKTNFRNITARSWDFTMLTSGKTTSDYNTKSSSCSISDPTRQCIIIIISSSSSLSSSYHHHYLSIIIKTMTVAITVIQFQSLAFLASSSSPVPSSAVSSMITLDIKFPSFSPV